ncbi:MAG TPA: phage protease [Thermodesulfobacteriota bacterium]
MKRQACHAIAIAAAADGTPPAVVHLLPAGVFGGRDGRGPWTLSDPAGVIAASMADAPAGLPIDFDHAIDYAAPAGRPAPAAGWITKLEARETGLWGAVEWTERGAAAIKAKEYRFLSPVFDYAVESGAVLRLHRAGLTNNPNLRLTALAAQERGDPMDRETFLRLVALFGLPATADAAAVVAHAQTLVERDKAATATLAALATAASLPATAPAAELVTAIQAKATPDPAKFVPIAQHQAVATQLAELQKTVTEEKATAAVEKAIQAGKLVPAMKEWGLELYRKDPKAFDAYVEKAPVVVQAGAQHSDKGGGTTTTTGTLTAEEQAVCAQLGLKPEAFAKAKAEQKEAA